MECFAISIHYGDAPTWIGAISTLAGLIFLALNFKIQSDQLKFQEQQLKDQKAEIKAEKTQEQANKFAFWVENSKIPQMIHLVNGSILPVNNVCFFAFEIQTGKLVPIYGNDDVTYGYKSVPRGSNFVHTLPSGKFDLSKEVFVEFTDSSGLSWKRSSNGSISRVSKGLADRIGRWLDVPQVI